MEEQRNRAERSDATREALIESAHRLFGNEGYSHVSLNQITAASGVTKGALYHHFPGGKKDLMEAVYERVEREFTESVVEQVMPNLAAGETGPMEAIELAIEATLEASLDPAMQQIVLIDSPSVLGWTRWREVADQYSLAAIKGMVSAAQEAEAIKPVPTETLAYLLAASLNEAILMIARAEDQTQAKADAATALRAILDGLKA